ncbi:PKD domain-containing protein [Shewanella canadensis]|uniref:PKD domain-containing protein n=1 Tax=Shewanella canadensis TaxID=271096 RepID=A0A3S0IT46_9GAMM|nr:PKD domain-containing protein [Shewanella canadensis]RTR39133.1 PKD domain-containing protein [Shewanella canadensis]
MDYKANIMRVALLSLSLSAAGLSGSDAAAANPTTNTNTKAISETPSNPGAQHRAFPDVNLPEPANGEHAIGLLGDKLPAMAAAYEMSTADFAKMIREDRSVWLDHQGRIFYVEVEAPADLAEPDPGSDPETVLSESQTFMLHSRPGASRVIHLDFDGHITEGRQWNTSYNTGTIVSPPYNREGSSDSFTQNELDYIYLMWKQVAEDYAPFDVDITTQEPPQSTITRSDSNDPYYGTRVVMTQDNFANCGCGGFAYVGVFDYYGDRYKPAFVFNTSVVGAGEAISHEAGHNLGLSHDGQNGGSSYYQGHGSGATGWAPIMGVGYYRSLVQWSKGEYPQANQFQDDIQVIQNYGAPLMLDDHGDSIANATALIESPNGDTTILEGSGLIRRRDDMDMFSFTAGAGSFTLNISPSAVSPNLDILAQLYNSSGTLIASNNPSSSLPAAISGSFANGGEYYLKVDGIGKGDLSTGYSDYGSLGWYSINGSVQNDSNLQAPTAVAASVGYVPGYAPITAFFEGSASTDDIGITGYSWDFGDGNLASGVSPSHEYQAPGEYTVTLTVTDSDNLTDSDTLAIFVVNNPPIAVANADSYSGTAPHSIQFYSTGSKDQDDLGTITYAWLFGDGNGSTSANPSHLYAAQGTYTPSLTVTDNLGDQDSITLSDVSISPPAYLDQYAQGEILGSGTVGGNYTDTFDNSSAQTIRERESGGRKSSRYSYLQHTWLFNVTPGNTVTLHLNAWMTNSSDSDEMRFSYSVNGGAYTEFTSIQNSVDVGLASFLMPQGTSGEVRIRVEDTDHTPGRRSLDTVTIQQLYISSETLLGGDVPATPTLQSATPISSSQIDINWTDASNDESGFNIERSIDESSWSSAGSVGANVTDFSDSGLSADTTYYYRVTAFNGYGSSVESNTVSATTEAASPINLTATGRKVKGVKHIDLQWYQYQDVDIYFDNDDAIFASGGSDEPYSYDFDTGLKGGATHTIQVCNAGGGDCSEVVTVIF